MCDACNPMQRLLRHLLPGLAIALALPSALAGPWRASEQNTSGWALMSPHERLAHQATVRGFTTLAECRAYQQRHHAEMEVRARAQGLQLQGGRDICAHLAPTETRP